MKKLLLILLCVPLIGFGQEGHDINWQEKRIPWDELISVNSGEIQRFQGGESLIAVTKKNKSSSSNDELIIFTGVAFEVFKNGQIRRENYYKEGKFYSSKEWFENGKIKMEARYYYDSFWGVQYETRYWYKNGQLMMYDEASDGGAYYECWDKNGLKIDFSNCSRPFQIKLYPDPVIGYIHTFLNAHHNSTWTDGVQKLKIITKNLEDKKYRNNSDQLVKSFLFEEVLYQEGCDYFLECSMCRCSSIKKNTTDTLILFNGSRDDFGGLYGSENILFVKDSKLIQVKKYFYDYETSPFTFTWIPVSADSVQINELRNSNKLILERYNLEKDSIAREYQKTLDKQIRKEEEEYMKIYSK